jgi:hypothetical protein
MDNGASYKKIQFVPPYSINEGVKAMVDYYRNSKSENTK